MLILDEVGLSWFQAHRSPILNAFMTGVSTLTSSGMCCLWAGLIALLLMWRGRVGRGAILFFGTVFSAILVEILKMTFARARPPTSSLYDFDSFPSGHTLCSTVILGLTAWVFSHDFPLRQKFLYGLAAGMTALVGLSRVYLGVHWPSDVLGSFLIGLFFIWGWLTIVQSWKDA